MTSRTTQTWLVTGGAGFIGSNLVLGLVARGTRVVTLDALTYAGNLENLAPIADSPRHRFVHGDIRDGALVAELLETHRPEVIAHLAAETHVDRSIIDAAAFVETNVVGTQTLLARALGYWRRLSPHQARRFRFVNVSTDEVFGSLGPEDPPFDEASAYAPNSPYAASKAAADHLGRAFHRTHGLPLMTIHAPNNYGPFQFPEKLVPLMVLNALERRPLPIYGDGLQVRDWLHVSDHCAAIERVARAGEPGQRYLVGAREETTNLTLVQRICDLVDALAPDGGPPRRDLITFVSDRLGHDRRYAIDASQIRRELGWRPRETLADGLEKTVRWYLDHRDWLARVQSGEYRRWLKVNYEQRPEVQE